MLGRFIVWLAFVCIALSRPALADTIYLLDGSTVEGEIIADEPMAIVVKTRAGKATIAKAEIKEIQKKATVSAAVAAVREKIDKQQKSDDKNIAAWLKLGAEAQAAGGYSEMATAFERVLSLDPENPNARTALGYVQRDGLWVKGAFFSPERTPATAPATPNLPLTEREKIKAMACVGNFSDPNEKQADCPRCHGTGVIMTFDCVACAKSAKPGSKIMADGRYVPCERCNGTRKVVGAYCLLCNKTGKVYLSQVSPADGGSKKAPEGFAWCGTCNGTGVAEYKECGQCKGSQWPGYTVRGDYALLCDRCAGKGKTPTAQCTHCNGKGIVPANPPAEKPK